ncbi:hypothetical protein GCM10009555_009030 [Acrocarpospora macrocephala]
MPRALHGSVYTCPAKLLSRHCLVNLLRRMLSPTYPAAWAGAGSVTPAASATAAAAITLRTR